MGISKVSAFVFQCVQIKLGPMLQVQNWLNEPHRYYKEQDVHKQCNVRVGEKPN